MLVDSPFLSYIDVRHANFLPPRLTVGEARDLGPYYTCLDELAPIRDEFAERVSRHRRELVYQQVEQGNPPPAELKAPAQEEEATAESVHSSGAEFEMVIKRVMSISHFVPDVQAPEQQQPPPAQVQSPPPSPPPNRQRKRPRTVEQAQPGSGDVPTRTPPRQSRGITIREPTPTAQNVASSSQTSRAWQPSFVLDGKPLPSSVCVRVWEKCEEGRIAQCLARGLLLPDDVHTFEDGTDESLGRRLQWHTIAVILNSLFFL